jgi:hypothetical protein
VLLSKRLAACNACCHFACTCRYSSAQGPHKGFRPCRLVALHISPSAVCKETCSLLEITQNDLGLHNADMGPAELWHICPLNNLSRPSDCSPLAGQKCTSLPFDVCVSWHVLASAISKFAFTSLLMSALSTAGVSELRVPKSLECLQSKCSNHQHCLPLQLPNL